MLAHRPQNHELWLELGRLYERMNKSDEAWLCYDHVQSLRPNTNVRDDFLARLTGKMDGLASEPWSRPTVAKRQEFLDQMVSLARRVSTVEDVEISKQSDEFPGACSVELPSNDHIGHSSNVPPKSVSTLVLLLKL